MCICFKENIRKWYAKRSIKSHERYMEDLDERLQKIRNICEKTRIKKKKNTPLYETDDLYQHPYFIW
jgi:hypothetical protein